MNRLTLFRENNPLADPHNQLQALRATSQQKVFADALRETGIYPLRAAGIEVLQLNLGKLCNMTCEHCHVDAGPERREIMSKETAQACIAALEQTDIPTLDLTGGAPEMNPSFRWMVEQASKLGRHIIDRCNLTILNAPGYTDLPQFLADHRVEIVASLPCYLEENVNAQRGKNAFKRSIEVLRKLNSLGYGNVDSGLTLTLVYNPVGPCLPPSQHQLEEAYKEELSSKYDIRFNRLFTITNMPIGRFLDYLLKNETYDEYMNKLIEAYNSTAATGVMCRTTLSVDWEGNLFDCDFNQMLDLKVRDDIPQNIRDFKPDKLAERLIVTGQHCFGCTAGAGSSCQGITA